MVLRYMMLGLLKHQGPRHGYALMKEVWTGTGLRLSIGNVYRELARLAEEGLVRSSANPAGADARRAPYEITPAGITAFDGWLLAAPAKTPAPHHDEFCARAFFLGHAAPAVGRKIIERWKDELDIHGKTLERAKEAAGAPHDRRDGSPIPLLSFFLCRSLRHAAVELEFVEELRSAHERWAASQSGSAPVGGHRPPASTTDRPRPRRARTVA